MTAFEGESGAVILSINNTKLIEQLVSNAGLPSDLNRLKKVLLLQEFMIFIRINLNYYTIIYNLFT